jgi:hypothetical protein
LGLVCQRCEASSSPAPTFSSWVAALSTATENIPYSMAVTRCVCVQARSLILSLFTSLAATARCFGVGMYVCCWQVYTLYIITCTRVADGIANSCSQYIQLYGKAQQPYVGSCSSQRHGDGSCGAEEVTGSHQITGEIRYTPYQ